MAQTLTVKNISTAEQYIIKAGIRYCIPPRQIRVMPKDLAELFLEKCSPQVVLDQGVNMVDYDVPGMELVWLFNTTGNPDSLPTKTVQRIVKRQAVMVELPNPNYEPRIISRETGGEQVVVARGAGKAESLNFPGRIHQIYPYTRKAFPKDIAHWMLMRDSRQEDVSKGALKLSRPPGPFEPNDTWDYEDLQIYAAIIDSKLNVGPTLEKLAKQCGRPGIDATTTKKYKEALEEAKDILLKRLFFRVVDPRYTLPEKEDFEAVKAELQKENEPKKRSPERPKLEKAQITA